MVTLFAPVATALAVRNAMPVIPGSRLSSQLRIGNSAQQQAYNAYGRAYSNNEIVFAAIEMLATSAGEPHIVGRKWQRESPRIGRTTGPTGLLEFSPGVADVRDAIHNEESRLLGCGLSRRQVKQHMISNGFFRELPAHPLVTLLRKPNPWMSRGQLWGTVVMDRALAGNSYLYKARVKDGIMKGAVSELWRLRPDRVKIIPSKTEFIEAYEYGEGQNTVRYPPEDIVHFKTRNPFDDYYGMPPLMPISGRVSIDDYMKNFLRAFFEQGGTGPGAILSVKQKLTPENKDEIREKAKEMYGGVGGFHEWMVLDQAETSFTTLGLDRGLRDALPKEIDAVNEARIAMVFGIPGSLLGLLIGYESSSYANKRQDWQVLWDLTMTPLLSDLDDVLNLQLVPDFNGIDEVLFDLSDIRALQEDVDQIQKRHRENLAAGLLAWEEAREAIGLNPEDVEGKTFFVPMSVNPTPGEIVPNVALPGAPEPPLPDDGDEEDEDEDADVPEVASPAAEVRHSCGKLIAIDIVGNPELFCWKCKEKFRPEAALVEQVERDDQGRLLRVTGSDASGVRRVREVERDGDGKLLRLVEVMK